MEFTTARGGSIDRFSSGTKDPDVYERYLAGVTALRDRHAPSAEMDGVVRWLWAVGAGAVTI